VIGELLGVELGGERRGDAPARGADELAQLRVHDGPAADQHGAQPHRPVLARLAEPVAPARQLRHRVERRYRPGAGPRCQ
jgi:hypothetical protein